MNIQDNSTSNNQHSITSTCEYNEPENVIALKIFLDNFSKFCNVTSITTNLIIFVVLIKSRKDRWGSTDIALLAATLSDACIAISLLVLKTTANHGTLTELSDKSIILGIDLQAYLTTSFHSASVWMTLLLALQRYVQAHQKLIENQA